MIMKPSVPFLTLLVLVAGDSGNAWALQPHGTPEGLYVHQMAHVLFMGSLAYLYWHTRKTQELGDRAWRFLQLFCIILFCWNILAFTGHEALHHLQAESFMHKDSWGERLTSPVNFVKVLYYITKMDHFLVVPAMLALVMSLRTFYLQACKEAKR